MMQFTRLLRALAMVAPLAPVPLHAQQPGAGAASPAATPPATTEIVPPPAPDADALAAEMRVLATSPNDMVALLNAGELALKLGDPAAAAGFFTRAERVEPRNGRLVAGRAALLVQLRRPGEALLLFQQAEALGYDPARFLLDRGLAYDLLGEQERAQRDYRALLKARDNDEAHRRYALSLGISGRREAALAEIDTLVRKQDRGAWRVRTFVLAMTGDVAGAESIAQSMLPPAMARGLSPFFARLAQLGAVDRAFAVHFGELTGNPARAADARLAPPLAPLPPEPVPARPPVVSVAKAEPVRPDPRRDRRRRGRDVAAVATPAPPPPPPIPAPPVLPGAGMPVSVASVATSAPAPVQPAPIPPATTPARSILAALPPAMAAPPPSVTATPVPLRVVVARPAPFVPVTRFTPPLVVAVARQPLAVPAVSAMVRRLEVVVVQPAPMVPVVSARGLAPARPGFAALSPPPVVGSPVEPAAAPVAAALKPSQAKAPEGQAPEHSPVVAKPAAPPPVAEVALKPAPAKPLRGRAARADAALDQLLAELDTKPKPEPKTKDKKEADAKAKKEAEAKAKARKPDPARIWVQVAGGASERDLARAWAAAKAKAPAAFKGRQGYTTPLRLTNRVLTGPFKTEEEAQAFVNLLAKSGLSAFVFTSEPGQKIDRLPAP